MNTLHELPNKENVLETKHRNMVQVFLAEMNGIDPSNNEALADWIGKNSAVVRKLVEDPNNENIRELARSGKYKEAASLLSDLIYKTKDEGVEFGLDEYYYKRNNIPEERQFKEGSRVVYGKGVDGIDLIGVIKTFVGKEAGFTQEMVGIDPEGENEKKFGRKAITVKELMQLNPDGAIVPSVSKEDIDKFKGYPKAA